MIKTAQGSGIPASGFKHTLSYCACTLVFIVSFTASMAISADSWATCGDIPQVEWWGNTSHPKIISYVKEKHQGDWSAYIGKWQKYLNKMQVGHAKGKSAIIPKSKMRIKGQALSSYIQKISARIEVMLCLQAEQMNTKAINAAPSGDDMDMELASPKSQQRKTGETMDIQPASRPGVMSQPISATARSPRSYDRLPGLPSRAEENVSNQKPFFRKIK